MSEFGQDPLFNEDEEAKQTPSSHQNQEIDDFLKSHSAIEIERKRLETDMQKLEAQVAEDAAEVDRLDTANPEAISRARANWERNVQKLEDLKARLNEFSSNEPILPDYPHDVAEEMNRDETHDPDDHPDAPLNQ